MNGGVAHLLETASQAQIAAAVCGFRFFRFDSAGQLLEDATIGKCDPEDATRRYGKLVPSDDVLTRGFEEVFASSPDAFDPLESLPCAACGFLTLSEETYGSYEICEVCGWEDDGVQLANPACGGGANHLSLIEMQTKVLRAFPLTVTERGSVLRSRSWRPLSPQETARAQTQRERECWANRAIVTRWECYWNGGRPFPKAFPTIAG